MLGLDFPPDRILLDAHQVPYYIRGLTAWPASAYLSIPSVVMMIGLGAWLLHRSEVKRPSRRPLRPASTRAAVETVVLSPHEFRPVALRGRWPWRVILVMPFALAVHIVHQSARRQVRWWSLLATFGLFEALMFVAEHVSVMRGFWVYNTNRIWGEKIWGVPIEEPLLWYSLPVIVVIFLFETLAGILHGTVQVHPVHALRWMPMRRLLTRAGIPVNQLLSPRSRD
jgi:hypothetical protein